MNTESINTLAYHSPLQAFDHALNIEDDEIVDFEKLQIAILQCVLAVAGYRCPDDQSLINFAAASLNNASEFDNKRQIGACLLRWLSDSAVQQWVVDKQLRAKITKIFDYFFEKELYTKQKIDRSEQPHVKIPKLVEIVEEAETHFHEALESLTTLDSVIRHRQQMMKILHSTGGTSVLCPFIPPQYESKLDHMYGQTEAYLRNRDDPSEAINSHGEAVSTIEAVGQIFKEFETIYSQAVAYKVTDKLLKLIQDDFAKNKIIQPAAVKVTGQNKKYPFHLDTINLAFAVSNRGSGYAYDVTIDFVADDSQLKLKTMSINLGKLEPGASQLVEITAEMQSVCSTTEILVECSWNDYGEIVQRWTDTIRLDGQRSDIDWETLRQSDPYSLEPIRQEEDLIGRKDVMNRLIGIINAPNAVGSSIIYGQKRVGKTSTALALQSRLQKQGEIVVYIEGGDYVDSDETVTVTRLAKLLCRRIRKEDQRLANLETPQFGNSLAPLSDYLDDLADLVSDRKVIIILDEFDELPLGLYKPGPTGNAFFLTLRSISARPKLGVVLVGGEKMRYVMEYQADKLNRWEPIAVDYFTRETDWADYVDLVQRPVENQLEFAEDALYRLHEITAGNPYFTKLLCKYIFEDAATRRDCHVTHIEIEHAFERAVKAIEANTFQHFWSDGLFDDTRQEEHTVRRRKVLVAVSDALKKSYPQPAPMKLIADQSVARNVVTLASDINEFATRKILLDKGGDIYDFKVPLFRKWLSDRGVNDIIAASAEMDVALRLRQQEEEAKISSSEIYQLVEWWGVYKGQKFSEDRIRVWLEQFKSAEQQRLMYSLLRGVHFYSDAFVRQKLSEIHNTVVRRGLKRTVIGHQYKRDDILVSYLDGPAKSGATFAKLYADEASIYKQNVVERSDLSKKIRAGSDIQALVFVDDFVCTGNSVSDYFHDLDNRINFALSQNAHIKVFFVAVVAYQQGWQKVEEVANQLRFPIETHSCVDLDESDRAFTQQSKIFPDPLQRESAKRIVMEYGNKLGLNEISPLGYGELGMTVVFESGCPNNTLPILWAEIASARTKWVPLFRR